MGRIGGGTWRAVTVGSRRPLGREPIMTKTHSFIQIAFLNCRYETKQLRKNGLMNVRSQIKEQLLKPVEMRKLQKTFEKLLPAQENISVISKIRTFVGSNSNAI